MENNTKEQKRNENKHENINGRERERRNIKRIINYLHTNELDISEI